MADNTTEAATPPPSGVAVARLQRADGLELLGEMKGSGYREAPGLVRRADGQTLQLTPLLYAVLEAIPEASHTSAVRQRLLDEHRIDLGADDLEALVREKLRPLGLLCAADGSEPALRRSKPLLSLRGRTAVISPAQTDRLASAFQGLFRGPVVAAVLVAFALSAGWVLVDKGVASGVRQALYQPVLLLVVLALTMLSAGFHELGHASACRYGGARPGTMGAGLYLVWPAFYTDVTDSYRLDRPGRLRVDLGGLYFNAVFSVATVLAWSVLRWDALLVVIPIQLLQMLRQLIPLVRFDGYHILADLTGVPDLFARIKPALLSLVPGRPHGRAPELKRWVRAVVTAWVLVVVPALALALALMVMALPRLAATTWDSLGIHWDRVTTQVSDGQLAGAAVGVVALLAIAAPTLGILLVVTRAASGAARAAWRSAGEDPVRRALVLLAGAALVAFLAHVWWPEGQYEPIEAAERGTLVDGLRAISGESPRDLAVQAAAAPDLRAAILEPDTTAGPGPGAERAGAPGTDEEPVLPERRRFEPPDPPGEGDNQAVAINRTDGSEVVDVSPSLVWEDDDEPVRSRNESYALASCRDCTTMAVAFQVVLAVGSNDYVAPENEAVAVNDGCVACTTRSLAMQTVLTLPEEPDESVVAEIDRVWSRVDGILAGASVSTFDDTYERLAAVEAEILALLDGAVGGPDHDLDGAEAPEGGSPAGSGSTSTTAGEGASTSTTAADGTTTTAPSTSTSTTEAPPTTTTTTMTTGDPPDP